MSQNNISDKHICEEMVTRIAKLARLRLTANEASLYQENFTHLLALFHELDDLNLANIPLPEKTILNAEDCREDTVKTPDLSQISKATPHFNSTSRYFEVPQFIEKNDE